MLTDKINDWLNGPQNFIIGRVLYDKLGSDERLKEVFKKGESPETKKSLRAALQVMVTTQTVAPVEKKINPITDEMPVQSDDEILTALASEWKPIYQRMNYLRANLDAFGESNTDESIAARGPQAFEVLELEQQCMVVWQKRDHYVLHGSLPDMKKETKELPTDPVALATHIDNIKKNIRKNRGKMQKPGANAKYAVLYRQYLNEFKSITGKDYKETISTSK
jgi:hypothetical protein